MQTMTDTSKTIAWYEPADDHTDAGWVTRGPDPISGEQVDVFHPGATEADIVAGYPGVEIVHGTEG